MYTDSLNMFWNSNRFIRLLVLSLLLFILSPMFTVQYAQAVPVAPPPPTQIIIIKNTHGGDGNFSYSLLGRAPAISRHYSLTTVNGTGTVSTGGIGPGTYILLENPVFDWTNTSASCDNGDKPHSITLGLGQTVICTFEAVKKGTITIKKNAPGGGTGFKFTQNINTTGEFTLDDTGSKVFSYVPPGTYKVTEKDPTANGYQLSGLTCVDSSHNSTVDIPTRTATIHVDAGDVVTCTYTNAGVDTVIVEKLTRPAGAAGSFDFTQTLDGTGGFKLSGGKSHTFTNVSSGVTHTITEADPGPSFDLTDIDCYDTSGNSLPDGDLGTRTATLDMTAGERIQCTFTNTQRGTVIIQKATLPAGGTGFGFTENLMGIPGTFSLDDTGKHTFKDIKPGSYHVVESDPSASGYLLSKLDCTDSSTTGSNSSGDIPSRTATINLDPGETVICTYSNTKQDTIVVEKVTLPAGTGGSFIFSQTIDASGKFSLSDGTSKSFSSAPGNYTITEDDPGTDFDLTGIDCHDTATGQTFPGDLATGTATLNLTAGEAVYCTYTNTQRRGTVIIQKATLPAGGTGFSFTGDLGDFSLDDTGTHTFNIKPGSYHVIETDPSASDYVLSKLDCTDSSTTGINSSGDIPSRTATINLDPGETVICTYSNTKQDTIVVEKVTLPAGTGGSFTFSQTIDTTGNFTLSDSNGMSKTFSSAPGNYTITEGDPGADFDLTGIDCHDTATGTSFPGDLATGKVTLNLTAGEVVHCTYENTSTLPPSLPIFPSSLDFGSQAVSTTSPPKTSTISNSGKVDLIISSLTLANPAEFILGPDNCSGKTLRPGETCTFETRFKPSQTGLISSMININTNAGITPYAVSGTGVASTGPAGPVKPIPTLSQWAMILLSILMLIVAGKFRRRSA